MIDKEVNLCKPVISWLQSQHWDVYQEVQLYTQSKRADIVAVRHKFIWIIEAKLNTSLALIEQAVQWVGYGNYVSVLTLRKNKINSGDTILDKLGLGKITVNKRPNTDGSYHIFNKYGRLNRVKPSLREYLLNRLNPNQMTGEFGESGNCDSTRWTPYKQTMDTVRKYLIQNGESNIKDIIGHVAHHYSGDRSAIQCIRKALSNWEDWCCVNTTNKEYLYSVKKVIPIKTERG